MPDLATNIVLGFAFLAAKHTAGDFFLQTPYQLRHKGVYGHPGGLLHAGIHAGLSLPIFWFLPPPGIAVAVAIPAGEFVAHYHIDWLKEQIVKRNGLTLKHPWYWRTLGLDQLAHALTYVAIAAFLAL